MKCPSKICMLLAVVLGLTAALSGCGNKEINNEEPYNIVWYSSGVSSAEDEAVYAEVNKYTQEKIGATVQCTPIRSSEFNDKMRLLFSSNSQFDMCFTSSSRDFVDNVKNGVFLKLDDLLQKQGKDIWEMTPDYFFECSTVGDGIYAIPVLKDVASEWVIACKSYLVEKYQIDLSTVQKLEDFTPIFETIKKNEAGIYPIVTRGNNSLFRFLPFEAISGSPVGAFRIGSYDTIVNQYDTDEARNFYRLVREWYLKGYIRKDAATVTNDEDIYKADSFFAEYQGYLPYAEENYKSPDMPDHKRMSFVRNLFSPYVTTDGVMGAALAVSANSQNPEKTMEFINLINTDKYLRNLMAYGIRDKHYVLDEQNRAKAPEGFKTLADAGYYHASNPYTQGNRFLLYPLATQPTDVWDKYKEFNETATKSGVLGFVFDWSNVSSEIAALQNVYQEFMPSLLVGAVDPDEYLPKAMEKFRSAGLDKVLKEIQRQLDEWKRNH